MEEWETSLSKVRKLGRDLGKDNNKFDLGTLLSLSWRLDSYMICSTRQWGFDLKKEIRTQTIETQSKKYGIWKFGSSLFGRVYRMMREENLRSLVNISIQIEREHSAKWAIKVTMREVKEEIRENFWSCSVRLSVSKWLKYAKRPMGGIISILY